MSNSLIEPYALSPWAKEKGLTHCFIYRGPSMTPTFQNGDFLYLCSVAPRLLRGDVIVFTDLNKKGFIVHRIISTSLEGLITRGDQNRLYDSSPITLDQIVGKVELVESRLRIKPVANGLLGLWLARIWHTVFWLERLFRRMFWKPYQLVRKSGLVSFIWRPNIIKMQVQKADGSQVKYIYKQRTVATWDPTFQRFDCRKPFDLVIPHPDEPQ
jgi:signal peptidase I